MASFTLRILYESKGVIVINKPCGLLVEEHSEYPSVESWVRGYLSKHHNNPYVGIVHRLDRKVSGAVIVAKKRSALRHLNEQFRNGQIDKFYFALTLSAPEQMEKTLISYLGRSKDRKKAVIVGEQDKNAKKAVLKYRIREKDNVFLWNISLYTGRFHQIRIQLTSLGCPIIGDTLYERDAVDFNQGIGLHCRKMTFVDPGIKQKITVESNIDTNSVWKNI